MVRKNDGSRDGSSLRDIPVRSFGRSIYCSVNPARAALQDAWLEQQFGPARGGK